MVLLNIFLLLSLYKTVLARPIPDGLAPYPLHFPKYEFGYAVHDGFTGDIKSQHEVRHGDNVAGHYSVLDADGHKRTVEYHADDITGFNAVVHRDGQGPLHHGQHAVYPAHGHPFHGGAVHPAATGPLAAGHPPPHPPPPGPHHEPPHHGHHHQHFVGALEGPVNHGHHPPPHPLPPAEFVRLHHATPVAHSSAFQRNYYQPHP